MVLHTSTLHLLYSFTLVFLVPHTCCYKDQVTWSSYVEKQILPLKVLRTTPVEEAISRRFPQNSRTQNGAIILEMKMKHTHHSSSPEPNHKHHQLLTDEARVKSIQSRVKKTSLKQSQSLDSKTQIPITSGINLQTLNYVVSITLGGQNLTLIVDTGSDLTWVQCQPCKLCYSQPEPLFNPLTSSAYKSLQCNSQQCNSLQSATGNPGYCRKNNPTCNYLASYGDGSYTRGDLGADQLVLGETKVENFVFGCGHDNKGLFGSASGLIGMGRSELSLISQTNEVFGGMFSYCLPDSDSSSSGSLVLGNDTSFFKITTPVSYTRLVQLDSFYAVNLTGISIGGVELSSPSFGNDEIVIDSGTVITRMKPSIYKAMKDEFLRQFSGYPLAPGFSILDTCFDLSGNEEVNVPSVKLWFEGEAEMNVDASGMLYFAKRDASQVCLAVASLSYEDEIGIIGNYQQKNVRVIYDTKEMRLGFAKEVCNFN